MAASASASVSTPPSLDDSQGLPLAAACRRLGLLAAPGPSAAAVGPAAAAAAGKAEGAPSRRRGLRPKTPLLLLLLLLLLLPTRRAGL
jgi:hypothetical protein